MKELSRRATEVDARRGQLETKQTELSAQRHELAVGNRLRQRVTNFATQAADGIDSLDFDQRQRLLRLIVEQVRIHGWQIELRLRIPLDTQPDDDHHPKAPDHHEAHHRGVSSKDRLRSLGDEFQEAMREESSAEVAALTGCGVTAMLSADHVDPDLGAEIYVLDRAPDYDARTWEAAAEIIVDGDGPATVETDGR